MEKQTLERERYFKAKPKGPQDERQGELADRDAKVFCQLVMTIDPRDKKGSSSLSFIGGASAHRVGERKVYQVSADCIFPRETYYK